MKRNKAKEIAFENNQIPTEDEIYNLISQHSDFMATDLDNEESLIIGVYRGYIIAEQEADERAIKAFCMATCGDDKPCPHMDNGRCAKFQTFIKTLNE